MSIFNCVLRSIAGIIVAASSLAASAGEVTYYHNDLAGSPVAATNASGQVIWRESYRPFGERLVNSAASTANKVWFTSRRQDVETGLVYMGARYYDQVMGRFVSTDPMQFQEGNLHSFNRYTYANNNPYRYSDPDGRNPILIAMGVGALLNGGLNAAVQYYSTGTIRWGGLGGVIDAAGDGMLLGLAGLRGAAATSEGAAVRALPDSALVCRGGTCTAERFAAGSGVTQTGGTLENVSVNSSATKSLGELSASVPNKQVGVSTVGDVRKAGGDVVPSPTKSNPEHCTMCGISPQTAEKLFTPTVGNPNVR